MNVIHVNSGYGNTIYKTLTDQLFDLGVTQRVYQFINTSTPLPADYDDYVDVRRVYKKMDRCFFHVKHGKAQKDFMLYLDDKNPDLLHAHTLFSNGYVAYQAYRQKKIPYVVAVRGTDVTVFFKYMVHLRKLGIEILRHAAQIIFISPSLKKELFEKYIPQRLQQQLEEKSVIIPNGIDSMYFTESPHIKKRQVGKKVTLLTAAWINKNKNQIAVCRAVEYLRAQGLEIEYRIVGGIQKENTQKKLIKQLQSFDFVTIVPRKDPAALLKEIQQADISVMVSWHETFGLFYVESLLQGTPIIYSKNRGIDGFFEDGVVGYAANPGSPKDIADKILDVLAHYEELSSNAVGQAEPFQWERIAVVYQKIYQSVIAEN